jgi:hypothetical protein
MPGTSDNWQSGRIQAGNYGRLYVGLAIPASGAHIKLASDGTPDATENPTAIHVGITEKGSKFTGKPTIQKFYGDEFPFPLKEVITVVDASFTGNWLQVMDIDVLAAMTLGMGTRADGPGFQKINIGSPTTVTYQSCALIFPLEADPTLFGIFHLYKAVQTAGFDLDISRKSMASSPFTFEGTGVTSRDVTDQVGYVAKQLSVGS